MGKRVTLKLKLEIPGVTLSQFTWPRFKGFMDNFIKALRAMDPNASVESMIPVSIKDGSIETSCVAERDILPAFRKVERGPTRNWTSKMRFETQPLYDYLEKSNGVLFGSVRGKLRKFRIPSNGQRKLIEGESEMVVYIEKVGGVNPDVSVRLFSGDRMTFKADEEIIKQLGTKIWEYAKVKGRAKWDAQTGELDSFKITEAIVDWEYRRLSDVIRENDGILPLALSVKSVDELERHRAEGRHGA